MLFLDKQHLNMLCSCIFVLNKLCTWKFISICNVVCHLRKYIIWNSMLLIDWSFPSSLKVPIFSRKVRYLLKRPVNKRDLNKLCSCIFILNPLCIGIFEKLYYRNFIPPSAASAVSTASTAPAASAASTAVNPVPLDKSSIQFFERTPSPRWPVYNGLYYQY